MRSFCEALRRLNWFHCALLGRCALPSFFYRVLLLSRRGKGTGPEYLAGRAPSLFSGKNSVKKKAKNQKSNAVARSSDEATEIKATNEERDRRSRFIGVFFSLLFLLLLLLAALRFSLVVAFCFPFWRWHVPRFGQSASATAPFYCYDSLSMIDDLDN